jgi:hypothetical protein
MSRIYLASEIIAAIQTADALITKARDIVQEAERAVDRAIAAGDGPVSVNDKGRDMYASAGRLVAQAMEELGKLRATGPTGFAFPKIAAIGSPSDFDFLHVDLTGGGPWTGIFTAKNYRFANSVNPNPWAALAVGERVLIEKCNMTGLGIGDDVQGHRGGIAAIDQDGNNNWFLKLDNDLKGAASAQPGEEDRDPLFRLRVIDDGSAIDERLYVYHSFVSTDAFGEATHYTIPLSGDLVGILYIPEAGNPYYEWSFTIDVSTEFGGVVLASLHFSSHAAGAWIELDHSVPVANERVKIVVTAGGDTKDGNIVVFYRRKG